MKIDFIGNIYIQDNLNALELSYLKAFSASVHYINKNNHLLGLYDISVQPEHISQYDFEFDEQFNLERSIIHNAEENKDSEVFPFYKSNLMFNEKAIKFSLIDVKIKDDFLYFIEYLSRNILFFYYHFFAKNAYCKVFDKEFFHFFNPHSLHGSIYFKLSEYGFIFRLSCIDDKITLHKGYYPISIKGKSYTIKDSDYKFSIDIQKQLESIYNKLSIIDIKNNALFEEEGTLFSFTSSETFNKLLQFHTLNHKLEHKAKDKIYKI